MARIDDLKRKLSASLDATGKALPGYKQRVTALRAEIQRLEGLATSRGATPMNPVG